MTRTPDEHESEDLRDRETAEHDERFLFDDDDEDDSMPHNCAECDTPNCDCGDGDCTTCSLCQVEDDDDLDEDFDDDDFDDGE